VLGGVIDSTLSTSHEASQRRATDYGTACLFAHLSQLELHATPYTAEIDPHHPVVIFPGSISSLGENILNAGVIVGDIQPAEGGCRIAG